MSEAKSINMINFAFYLKEYKISQSNEAITAFYNAINALLFRVAYSFVGNRADAEDVLQTSFLKIMTSLDQCKGLEEGDNEAIKAWCLSIVRNVSRMKIRSQKSRKQREIKSSERMYTTNTDSIDLLHDKNQKELYKNLNTVLMELPEKYRVPIHLKFLEGMDYKEISIVLAMNVDTLRVQVKRGLEKMSISLKKIGIISSTTMLSSALLSLPHQVEFTNAENILKQCLQKKEVFALQSKSRLYFLKSIILVISILVLGGIYLFYHKLSSISPIITSSQGLPANSYENQSTLAYIWDFANGDNNGTKLLKGNWTYNKEKKGMQIDPDQSVILRLPVKTIKKNFVVDFDLDITSSNTQIGYSIYPFFSQNEKVLSYKKINPVFRAVDKKINYNARIYFIDKYILVKSGEGGFLTITVLEKSPLNCDISIFLKSYFVKRIEMKEMETSEAALKAIEELDEKNMINYDSFTINEFTVDKVLSP